VQEYQLLVLSEERWKVEERARAEEERAALQQQLEEEQQRQQLQHVQSTGLRGFFSFTSAGGRVSRGCMDGCSCPGST
jgi:hypothetical protein